MLDQCAFQLERADAVVRGFEHVVAAADIGDVAVGVTGGDVALQAFETPGHTMGHSSFIIKSGNASLFLTGDTVHHNILLENPKMEVGFDTDSKMGVDTRVKMLDMLASNRLDTLIYHMAWPGIGNIVKTASGFRFIARPQQVVL